MSLGRSQYNDTVFAQLPYVALGGRVFPHFAVHGRRNQQRTGAFGHTERREQVVSQAVREFCKEVSAGRRDQNGIGATRQLNVCHVVGHTVVPGVGMYKTAG